LYSASVRRDRGTRLGEDVLLIRDRWAWNALEVDRPFAVLDEGDRLTAAASAASRAYTVAPDWEADEPVLTSWAAEHRI
jgi:hypothetical protein